MCQQCNTKFISMFNLYNLDEELYCHNFIQKIYKLRAKFAIKVISNEPLQLNEGNKIS